MRARMWLGLTSSSSLATVRCVIVSLRIARKFSRFILTLCLARLSIKGIEIKKRCEEASSSRFDFCRTATAETTNVFVSLTVVLLLWVVLRNVDTLRLCLLIDFPPRKSVSEWMMWFGRTARKEDRERDPKRKKRREGERERPTEEHFSPYFGTLVDGWRLSDSDVQLPCSVIIYTNKHCVYESNSPSGEIMSSDESNQHRSDESHSDDPLKEKKVCFICGSHTIFIINIHEPRSGPNMIDVISEKFKMRPLNDDKFLCYSCNNWLINWYSMQNKYDRHNETDSSSAASTAREIATASGGRSGGNISSSSGNSSDRRSDETAAGNRRRKCMKRTDENDGANATTIIARNYLSEDMPNDTHDTVSGETMGAVAATAAANSDDNDGILFTAAIQAVRTKLQKYLYCPNKRKRDDGNEDERHMPLGAFNRHRPRIDYEDRSSKVVCRRRETAPDAENRQQEPAQLLRRYKGCELCKRPVQRSSYHQRGPANSHQVRRSKSIRLCRKCKLSMHMHICSRLACLRPNRSHTKCPRKVQAEHKNRSGGNAIEDNDILNGSNIVSKLKLLGTTIYYETEECFHRKQQQIADEHNDSGGDIEGDSVNLISSTNEIDMDVAAPKPSRLAAAAAVTRAQPATNERSTNDPNEIVLTFNTVVTEVFPMRLLSDADIDYPGTQRTPSAPSTNGRSNSFHEIIKNIPKSLTITLAWFYASACDDFDSFGAIIVFFFFNYKLA